MVISRLYTGFHRSLKRKTSIIKLPPLINGKLAIFLIFLLSIPAVKADDDDENINVYFHLADLLCVVSSICVCSKLIYTKRNSVYRCKMIFSINLISAILSTFAMFLGRNRTIKAAIKGLISVFFWLVPSIIMLPSEKKSF